MLMVTVIATSGATMSRPILVGLALRKDDAAPVALARTLADISGAPIALATVFPYDVTTPIATIEYAKAMQNEARTRVEAVAQPLRADYDVATYVCQGSRPGALHDLAQKLDARAIVVGSSHHGTLGRALAGDVAAGLLHGARCPVAVTPWGYEARAGEPGVIGVAFQDTAEGREAAETAIGLARRTGAAVHLVTVVEPLEYTGAYAVPAWVAPGAPDRDTLERHARERVDEAIAELADGVTVTGEVRYGPVVGTLADASKRMDILVCGSRGYGALHSALAGGVSRGLAHASTCPLLLVPRRVEPDAALLGNGRSAMRAR
jgi:nucleotide-binding universal stress UspA family protein